jgi:hypothetical protein
VDRGAGFAAGVPENRHIDCEHVAILPCGEIANWRKISYHDLPDAEEILSRAEHVL